MTYAKSFRLLIALLLICVKVASAQERDLQKIADSITIEADILYKSEWASWYGTDIFSEKCPARRQRAGGYISYDTGKGLTNVFFSNDAEPKILSTISFGYDYNSNNYKIDTADRAFTIQEKELYTIRQTVIADIYKDTIYKHYKNASINPVPIITKNSKKVYVLSGTSTNGVVIFGNDYLVTFDKYNKIVNKKKIHRSIIPVEHKKPGAEGSQIDVGTMHTHLPETGDFITATDICTFRLYEKLTPWNYGFVLSKDYVSIWNCKKDKLSIITKEEWTKNGEFKGVLKTY